jgi:D-alanyl-D-alanine dipeptidase
MFGNLKQIWVLGFWTLVLVSQPCGALSEQARAKGFVYLHEVDPTILASLRYATSDNFTGKPVRGYQKPVVVLTRVAAEALKKVQAAIKKDGYGLVVYDGYRPQQAVDCFVEWGKQVQAVDKQLQYYPRVLRHKVLDLGYVASRSEHSRGSTVDVTLIKLGKSLQPIQEVDRRLLDGMVVKYLDDGTLDMGTSFDLFDKASHHVNYLIDKRYKKCRSYLKIVMEMHGFRANKKEWWHYTLINEPYPAGEDAHYFNFEVN